MPLKKKSQSIDATEGKEKLERGEKGKRWCGKEERGRKGRESVSEQREGGEGGQLQTRCHCQSVFV